MMQGSKMKAMHPTWASMLIALVSVSVAPAQTPQAWLTFESNFNDQTTNGYNGTSYNVTRVAGEPVGRPGNVAYFNGSSSTYLSLPHIPLNSRPFGIGFFCKFASVDSYGLVMQEDSNATRKLLHLQTRNANQTLYFGFLYSDYGSSYGINSTNWYHVYFQYTGSRQQIYVNGIYQGSEASSAYLGTAGNTIIGRTPAWGNVDCNPYYHGYMDDFRVYYAVLSQDQIMDLANVKWAATNIVVTQRPGTKLVDINYDIVSSSSNVVQLMLNVQCDGTNIAANNVEGDIGGSVSPGTGRSMVWDAGADWSGNAGDLEFIICHPTATQLVFTGSGYVDARDYALIVNSDGGSLTPPTGTNLYAWGSAATCTVSPDSTNAGIHWRNLGWAGTGSIPESGTTNTTGELTLTSLVSTITWEWEQMSTVSIENAVASQRHGTKLVDISYDLASDLANAAWITLSVAHNGTNLSTSGLSGDVGADVLPGEDRVIVWDAGANWDGNVGDLAFSVSHAIATQYVSTSSTSVDTRNYALEVVSIGGSIAPPVGTNYYPWLATFTCSAAQTSVVSGINWLNTGWTGTGSIPASGTSNTTAAVVLSNLQSSITWNWQTAFAVTNVVAFQRPGTKLVDITYDIISDVTNGVSIALAVMSNGVAITTNGTTGAVGANILPGTGKAIVWDAGTNWNGNAGGLVFSVKHAVETQFVSSTSRTVDSRDYKLTVASAQGSPSPAVGTNLYAWGSSVTCSVAKTSLVAGVNWRCTGWTGTGSVPSTGATNITGNIALTGLVSSISWNWQTSFRITNVVATQQIGAKTVSITYDIVSDVFSSVPISLAVTSNGVALATNGLTGDFGASVVPGSGKTITWNAGANWNGNVWGLVFAVGHTSLTQFVSTASSAIDSRDYKLTVVSPRGSPSPAAGTNLYAWRAPVTCTVAPTTTVSGVKWRNTGWTGTGSIPASGTTNTTGAVTLSNTTSTITWNWSTPFAITNVAAAQRPGTKLVDITYDIVSELGDTVPIALVVASNGIAIPTNGLTGDFGSAVPPGAGKALVWDAGANWNGNVAALAFTVRHSSQTQFVATGSCPVDTRTYTLTVTSDRGDPTPAAGTSIYSWGASVVCSDVQTSYVGGIKWRNMGWMGTGSIPAVGATNTTGALVLTNPVSSITWNWEPWFVITNIAQRAGTKIVDIQYDISSTATNVFVSLAVSNGGVQVAATNLSGHVGNVVPGMGKGIAWNMGTDWNGNLAELTFTLTARPPDYIVVNLSSGPTATNYPVSYRSSIPVGGWTDGFKTTNLVLRRIPAGSFIMGSPTNELGRNSDETQCPVTLTRDYYIGVFEVTQKQWERVTSNWPSYFTNAAYRDTRPVESVGYNDIRGTSAGTNWPANNTVDSNSFAGLLRAKTGLTFDLPTEAQWEYACRAGTTNALNSGYDLTSTSNDTRMAEVGRYYFNGGSNGASNVDTNFGTAKVGTYATNAWGLFDVHGGVWELCLDWYGEYSGPATDPLGAVSGTHRVRRGGSWDSIAALCRSGRRGSRQPSSMDSDIAFRVSVPASQTTTAIKLLDSRDYRLTVTSERANPTPAVGTNIYAWRASVTCSVARTSLVSGVNWRCTGWTGTGSIPASGTTNTTGPLVLTNTESSITWTWDTSFAITNVTAVQRPGTKIVDIVYDLLSDVTNYVTISLAIDNSGAPVPTNGITGAYGTFIYPGLAKTIVWNAGTYWSGNVADLDFAVSHRTTTQLVGSCTGAVDTRNYSLAVSSVRGSPSPPAGTNSSYSWRATVTATVRNVAGYTMAGWTGTGSIPATGAATNTGPVVLSNLVSSIVWNWTTNDYTVAFDARGGTAPSPASKVVTYAAAYGALPVTTRDYYHFAGWWTDPVTGSLITSNTTVSRVYNHTLFAHWTIYTYPVTLHPGSYGRIVEANSNQSYVASVDHGATLPTVSIVPNAGYSFTGWSPAAPGAIVTNFEATAQYTAVSPPIYDVGVGSIAITNSGNYIITGTTASNTIAVEPGIQANITLINVSVVLSNGCAFHINGGASVNLTLLGTGTNRFTSCADHAGIHLAADSSLAIASNSTATLIAQGGPGGAGLGGGQGGASGTIAIRGGTVQATGGLNAAGMGGGSGGSCNAVVVEGTAKVVAMGGDYGPGIGSGFGGATNLVTIGGSAVVQARGGSAGGAGIGGGQSGGGGTILIGANAAVTATGGLYSAGIGGGSGGGGGNVTIEGNAVVAGTGGDYGAGIGGGLSGPGGTVLIADSSTVTATGATGAAGIGGGFGGAGGTIDIYALATIRAGADMGSAVVVVAYGGEYYVHIAHLAPPGLAIMSATGSNFVFSAATNGYSGYAVEGADCALLPGGAWDWRQITNYTVNPDGSISVPLDGENRQVIRLKLTP